MHVCACMCVCVCAHASDWQRCVCVGEICNYDISLLPVGCQLPVYGGRGEGSVGCRGGSERRKSRGWGRSVRQLSNLGHLDIPLNHIIYTANKSSHPYREMH